MYLEKEYSHFEAGIQYKKGKFERNFLLDINSFTEFRRANQQHSLFVTAYRYDNAEIRTANMIGNFYLDFDVTDVNEDFQKIREDAMRTLAALKSIYGIPKESVEIYFSGNKGIHFIIPSEVMGVQPHEELNMVFKKMAEDLSKLARNETIDTRIYDKVRLLRIPNSVHTKTGFYKVPISFEELRDLEIESIKQLASQPRNRMIVGKGYVTQANRIYQSYVKGWEQEKARISNRKKTGKELNLNFMPPCIEHIMEEGSQEGKRNNTVAVLASYFMQRGISEEDTVNQILIWNQTRCTPMLSEREVERTIQSIFASNSRYGCRTLEEISVCSDTCRLFKPKDD